MEDVPGAIKTFLACDYVKADWLDACRVLRNASVKEDTAKTVTEHLGVIIECAIKLLNWLMIQRNEQHEEELRCVRVTIQILGNVLCVNPECVNRIWMCIELTDYWPEFIDHSDVKVREYSAMLLFNCLRLLNSASVTPSQISPLARWKHLQAVCDVCLLHAHNCEWHSFIVELMLTGTEVPMLLMAHEQQIAILSVMRDCLNRSLANPSFSQPRLADCNVLSVLALLRQAALANAHWTPHVEPAEVVLSALHLMADAAQDDGYRQWLCEQRQVTVDILLLAVRTLHFLITEYATMTASSASQYRADDINPDQDNTVRKLYSWQRVCVRLVGNLSYHCMACQQAAGAHGCIEALHLGCILCPLDLRRPFLREWAQVALRNLMENSQENQRKLHEIGKNNDRRGTVANGTAFGEPKLLTEDLAEQMGGMQL